ncbi:hypothetical protein D3C71_1363130 [compost metagenome]
MRGPGQDVTAESRHDAALSQQDAVLRIQLDVAATLGEHPRGGGRRRAFYSVDLRAARRQNLDVAAAAGLQAGTPV